METVQISARIEPPLKAAIASYCRASGMVMNQFVREALIDRLEELEDIESVKNTLSEPTRPLSEVLRKMRPDGRV